MSTSFRTSVRPASPVLSTPPPLPAVARCEGRGRQVRVVVEGELDLATGPLLRAQIDQALERLEDGGVLTIDLAAVSFMDSWGSLPLEAALAGTASRSGELVLARPTARSLQVLRLLGWDVGSVAAPREVGAGAARLG